MRDLRYYKITTNDKKEWIDDIKQNRFIIRDDAKIMRDSKEVQRLKRIGNLKPFGDADGDKIPNIIDKRPFKKDKSVWGFLLK
jgi:hypothetical protein